MAQVPLFLGVGAKFLGVNAGHTDRHTGLAVPVGLIVRTYLFSIFFVDLEERITLWSLSKRILLTCSDGAF